MVSKEALMQVKKMLMVHEGFSAFPYDCPAGKLTIGYGRNLESNGISKGEAMNMLMNDIKFHADYLSNNFDFFCQLNPPRQAVLINMSFNLGIKGLMKFKRMLHALSMEKYTLAAREMLNSKWAKQVKRRSHHLANIMREGKWA